MEDDRLQKEPKPLGNIHTTLSLPQPSCVYCTAKIKPLEQKDKINSPGFNVFLFPSVTY